MSGSNDAHLAVASDALGAVEEQVQDRIDAANRLYGVVERKQDVNDRTATFDRARSVRRVLERAEDMLADHDAHRERLHQHVQSYPQIEGGVYHGQVQRYDALVAQVEELDRRIRMELAVARYNHDLEPDDQGDIGDWEETYDWVRETSTLLTHVRRHDVPDVVHEHERREGSNLRRYLEEQGMLSRLSTVRRRMKLFERIDHDAVARNAASVNGELAAEYRQSVDRVRTRYAELQSDLAVVAKFVAGMADFAEVLERVSRETDQR